MIQIADLRATLRQSASIAIGIVILTLTGIFEAFANSEVIPDRLTLSTVLLVVLLAGTGYFLAVPHRSKGRLTAWVNGTAGALVVALGLLLLIAFQFFVETRYLQDGLEPAYDMSFYFRNLEPLLGSSLTFGSEMLGTSAFLLAAAAITAGSVGVMFVFIPSGIGQTLLFSSGIVIAVAVLRRQIDSIITLPDAVALAFVFTAAYLARKRLPAPHTNRLWVSLAIGAGIGLALGFVILLFVQSSGLDRGSILRGTGSKPYLLEFALENAPFFLFIMAAVGLTGALTARAGTLFHNGLLFMLIALLAFGLLNWQDEMTLALAVLLFALFGSAIWFVPRLGQGSAEQFEAVSARDQSGARLLMFLITLVLLLIVPVFAGSSITSTLVLVMLYITMGIGLNVMVGYAGLLDLGYVASYAIGAYTAGVLTTPSLVTCGGLNPDEVRALVREGQQLAEVCSGMMTFWQAWPLAVLVAALTGMLLGVPVLRLRGDYLAIVTLGFGQIINRLINSDAFKELLGGPQGITEIPNAVLDLRGIGLGYHEFVGAQGYYYLFLLSVLLATFVVLRLINTRLGRAWRALRADEDVAEAMGINLVQTKLLAFGLSSAFAGLGGAVFGAWLRSIFPNSFELAVSINVLALIIIGGMGSVPGVVIGAFVLVGIPELLRELTDYRLLAFGILLVVVMLLRPEGLLPPTPPKLTERIQGTPDPALAPATTPTKGSTS